MESTYICLKNLFCNFYNISNFNIVVGKKNSWIGKFCLSNVGRYLPNIYFLEGDAISIVRYNYG